MGASRARMGVAGALVLGQGCGLVTDPIEGTWLFRFDRDIGTTGDCAVDDEVEEVGEAPVWVDIFTTASGEVVVLLEDPLIGSFNGTRLSASWADESVQGEASIVRALALDATWDGELLVGTLTGETVTTSSEVWTCGTQQEFRAERNVSDPDRYVP